MIKFTLYDIFPFREAIPAEAFVEADPESAEV